MSIKFYNKKTNSWEICGSSHALETPILDVEEHFESKNVEGALRELGSSFSELSRDFEEHILNHPSGSGGGGGTVLPTISSTFEGGVLEEGTEIEIDLFFNSPNLGKGTAYISINGLEAMDVEVKQGNNVINIGVLNDLKNSVMIYVVDRAGLTSNQLAWEIVSGGITMDINFDTEVDYGIDDIVRMPYIITTESKDPVFLNLTIDGVQYTYNANVGYNEHVFSNLGVGVHKISAFATTGICKSANHHFNLVVVNSYSLYLSSGTEETVFELGNPININYRISKISSENFTIKQYIDDNLYKELSLPVGNYYWTVNSLDLGYHKLKITAESSSGEFKELEFTIEIKEGDYVPVQPVLGGLIAWFDATEKTNNDLDRNVWVDKIGGNIGTLHNFNYYTNGWLDGKLNCTGKAYVKIDMTPYKDNVKLGSTIDIIYKAKNIGIETARVLDYTDVTSPYKGIYIDLLNAKLSSITNNATVNLDEDREIRVTFVVDRLNKFAFVYVDAVLCRAFSLSDLGSGVNKVYEDFTHNQKIYLNSEKGTKNYGSCEIKHLRIYNRALNYDEVLQNHISDIKDLREQRELYRFNYENTTTPVIRMYGDDSNMTGDNAVPMRVKYVSPDEDQYGQSFDLNYCQVKWQGTSSLQYVLKNYSITFKDDTMADYYYSPFKDGTKENILCLKADKHFKI